MTVSQPYAPLSFECTGETTRFQVSWPFMTPRDLVVSLVDGEKQSHPLKIETHFKVDGKSVVLNEAPPVGCVVLVARRTMPVQPIELKNKDTETALDRIVLVVQENFARAQRDEGLALAIHQSDIDRAVEAYLNDIGPKIIREIYTEVVKTIPEQPPAVQETSVIVSDAPQDLQDFLTYVTEEIERLKTRLSDQDQIIEQQSALIKNAEFYGRIATEALAIQDDDTPIITKYPVFAKAFGLQETSSFDEWQEQLEQFRRRA